MGNIVVEGITENGDRFRPSDWAEMICSNLSSYGKDNRVTYNRGVHPCMINGQRCLVIARDLQDSDPDAYNHVMKFAEMHHLKIQRDRRVGERALDYP